MRVDAREGEYYISGAERKGEIRQVRLIQGVLAKRQENSLYPSFVRKDRALYLTLFGNPHKPSELAATVLNPLVCALILGESVQLESLSIQDRRLLRVFTDYMLQWQATLNMVETAKKAQEERARRKVGLTMADIYPNPYPQTEEERERYFKANVALYSGWKRTRYRGMKPQPVRVEGVGEVLNRFTYCPQEYTPPNLKYEILVPFRRPS